MGGRVGAVVEQCWHRVPGGTAASVVRSLEALARRGDWEVLGVAAAHRGPPGELAVPTVEVCHMPLPRFALYEAWHRVRRPSIQASTGRLDVVHATGGVVPPAGGAALVATVHDLAFLRRPRHFSRRGAAFMSRAWELVKRHAALVTVPSQHTFEDCVSHGLHPDRLRVVPWGVWRGSVSEQARDAVRSRYLLPSQFLLWVGTAEPRKNLESLAAAAARSGTRLPLLLVGPAGWGVDVEELIARTTVEVRHLGPVPDDDLRVLYDLAEVFVYPSLMEGFGMPVLEAMAQGAAVITSAGTATAEVAGPAALLVDPTDVDSIAQGVRTLVGDAELREELGAAAQRRAAAMSWSRTAEGIAAVYDEAVR